MKLGSVARRAHKRQHVPACTAAGNRSASSPTDVIRKEQEMSIFASRSTTFKRVAAFAAAAAILSSMAIASTAEAARVYRQPPAGEGYGAPRDPAYWPGYNRQCMTDEGQGRFYPCDSNGEAN
jgi:hypothetical protein